MSARYIGYAAYAALSLLGVTASSLTENMALFLLVMSHNVFVHWVLSTRRYNLFRTPLNFLVHLSEVSLVVLFSGGKDSELFTMYLFLLIGYMVYSRRYWLIALISVILCLAYGAVLLFGWFATGTTLPLNSIMLRLGSILLCGWLVATISDLLRRAEDGERRRIEELALSEATIRTILDNTGDPIFVYDKNETISEVNNRGCEFLGVSRDEILGRRFRTFMFDDGTLSDILAEVHNKGEHHGEQIFVDAEGQERVVALHIRAFMHEDNGLFVVVARDITEQKNLQEAARQTNVKLARLNRELQQVNELKTGLLKTLSQRLRSPLTAIAGYLDMLLGGELGELTEDQRKSLQTCRRSATRVFRLIDDVFDIRSVDVWQNRVHPDANKTFKSS